MGFFSDLKDDLSQAVSDMKPENEEKVLEAEEPVKEESEGFTEDDFNEDALSDLLDKLDQEDGIELPGEKAEEEAPAPAPEVAEAPAAAQYAEPEYTEPEYTEPEYTESRYTEPEYTEPEYKAPEYTVPEYTVPEPTPVPEFSVPEPAPFIAPEPTPFVAPAPAPVSYASPVISPNRVASDEVSCIMESMIINGNIATEGSLELRGCVVGNVEVLGKLNITGSIEGNSSASEIFADGAKVNGEIKSMGSIKIGQSTTIIGNVSATSAVVAGAVKGDIDVRGPVILDSTAIVLGNIKSKSVQINNGAVIEGMCSQCYAEVNPKSFFEELKKMK